MFGKKIVYLEVFFFVVYYQQQQIVLEEVVEIGIFLDLFFCSFDLELESDYVSDCEF